MSSVLSCPPDAHRADPAVDPPDGSFWWLCQARPQRTKALCQALRVDGVGYYLPLGRYPRRTPTGRVYHKIQPLFSGYLFLLGDSDVIHSARRSRYVASLVSIADQEQIVSDLRNLDFMLRSGDPVYHEPTYEVGDRVMVTHGIFAGREGRIVRRMGKARLAITIECLQRSVSVELDPDCVEPIEARIKAQ